MKLFALNSSRDFGEAVAADLKLALTLHEERNFEDGEHKTRPLENVRNEDVFLIHSLYSDAAESVNDKLCRRLFFYRRIERCRSFPRNSRGALPVLWKERQANKIKRPGDHPLRGADV